MLRVSMELGGNAPFLVFEDADLDAAVDGAMIAKMRNMGEACTAANRFHVHESVAEEFAAKLAERMAALTVGRGTDDGHRRRSADRRQAARQGRRAGRRRGGQGRHGGHRRRQARGRAGYFFTPTVLADVPATRGCCARRSSARSRRSPPSTAEAEAIAAANDTEFGLVSYVFTRDLDRALRVSEALETGMVGLNQGLVSNAGAPFGGVKQSGLGREGGNEGLAEYLETKYVAIKL